MCLNDVMQEHQLSEGHKSRDHKGNMLMRSENAKWTLISRTSVRESSKCTMGIRRICVWSMSLILR